MAAASKKTSTHTPTQKTEIETHVDGDNLILVVPLHEPKLSNSGKANLVASSGGFKALDLEIHGKPARVSYNVIVPKD